MKWPEPDPRWIPFLRIGYAYFALLLVALLGFAIALGEVKSDTSYGLKEIIAVIMLLAGISQHGAFSDNRREESNSETK